MSKTNSLTNRLIALALSVVMVLGMLPTSIVSAESAELYGNVTTYTGGTVTGDGTADVQVLVEETTLQWVAANELRAEGWWVGIDVIAPDGFSADATYMSKSNPNAEYGAAKRFAD